MAIVKVIFATTIYTANLIGCYDGDTCKLRFENAPPFLAERALRFEGFDAPEMRGKCAHEKRLARQAREVTLAYMQGGGKLIVTDKPDKYGRLLVRAPELQKQLIEKGLAYPYAGCKRKSWCQDSNEER